MPKKERTFNNTIVPFAKMESDESAIIGTLGIYESDDDEKMVEAQD